MAAPPTRFRRAVAQSIAEQRAPTIRARLCLPDRNAGLESFEDAVDDAFRRYREDSIASRGAGPLHKAWLVWDGLMTTDELELLDLPETPPHVRERLLEQLHRWNTLSGFYTRIVSQLGPRIARAAKTIDRPIRLLELGCGDGALCFALEAYAIAHDIDVEIVGSDLHPHVTDRAATEAQERGSHVRFKPLDALDLSDLADDAFDFAFCAQIMHHFTPGKLARMLHEAHRVSAIGIHMVDVARQPLMPTAVKTFFPLLFDEGLVHDGHLSTRRAYSRTALSLIAQLSLDTAATVRWMPPVHTVLTTGPA